MSHASILDQFDDELEILTALSALVKRLLKDLFIDGPVPIHSIRARVKPRDSLERKLLKDPAKYLQLADITDVCAARVITYFEDQVDAVAEVIEREFEIDRANSIDKRKATEPDRFGYTSLHYICGLSPARAALTENTRFAGRKFEIQVRSILQHAWAEIEHDLQYKSELSVPFEIRRRFARLAGLLELADSEFSHVRRSSDEYRKRVSADMKTAPSEAALDAISLRAFIQERPTVGEIDAEIAKAIQIQIRRDEIPDLAVMISMASVLRITTIEQIETQLGSKRADLVRLAVKFLKSTSEYISRFPRRPSLPAGISIVYLLYLLFAKLGTWNDTKEALQRVSWVVPPDFDALAREIHAALSKD